MIGKIFITGLIGSIAEEKGIELIDVIEQVKKQPDATAFDTYLSNTEGGVVEVGDDIYDYLSALDKKTPVTTIAKGLCASISTKIFMAGSKRIIHEGCEFMIHLPMLSADYLNSNELEFATKEMKDLDSEMVEFYSKQTGTEKEAIYPLMRNETYLTPDQAVNLGFATEKREALKAVAYRSKNSKTEIKMSETKLSQEDKNWFLKEWEKISKSFKSQKVNLILQDENGVDVNFESLEDGATPSIGDMATVDGVPAEGSYIMPSLGGITAVFTAGELTEIIEVSTDGEDTEEEMAQLKSENERLTSEIETLTNTINSHTDEFKELETKFLNFKRKAVSKFNFDSKKEKEKDTELSPAKIALNKLKNRKK